jgi:tol-pal system protein YbgF
MPEQASGPYWGSPRESAWLLAVALLVTVGASSLGCVTVAEHRKLERRVVDLQRNSEAGQARKQLADLAAELDDLQAQLREMTGRLEEVQQLSRQSLEEARKARREAAAAAAGGPGAKAKGQDGASRPEVVPAVVEAEADAGLSEELKSYKFGLAAWRDKDYPVCIDRFRAFLQTYASSSRADDAAFWIADCHYKQGEFKNAVLRFDDVVRNYPTGNRAPDALYRQGQSLLKLGPGFHEAARRAFERVLKEYPDSARAEEAKRQLEVHAAG